MATEMQDDKYNGWAVIHKDYLVDDDGRNYHIVEVHILSRADGKDYIEIRVEPSSYPVNYHGEYHYRSGATKQQLKSDASVRMPQLTGYRASGSI